MLLSIVIWSCHLVHDQFRSTLRRAKQKSSYGGDMIRGFEKLLKKRLFEILVNVIS